MYSRATESEILELENKLLHPTAEPISLPLSFLRYITNDFSDEQELGRGGYGVVYKGLLQCGLTVAVKKIRDIHLVEDDIRLFEKEVTSLMRIRHQNVVQLLGYCAESSWEMVKLSNGNCVLAQIPARIFCFEYLCNKGLDNYLLDESSGLDWNMRYKLIKGICSGLDFLHECNIIHLDLKPPNILMDSTMVPKIADFGLSRLLGEQKNQTVTKNPVGTPGYMSPEYRSQGIITKKVDIFSLGVIIIEILTGHRDYPLYPQSTGSEHFIEKVLSNWRNRFESALKYTALELHTQQQQVKQCINIALECVDPDKDKRPNAFDIIKKLNEAEQSCSFQKGEDLQHKPVLGRHGLQHYQGSLVALHDQGKSGVLRDDGLVALNKIALKDHAQAWMKKCTMKSAVAPLQPQHEPVLESVDSSLAALCYQGARNASFWVAHKALASLEDNVLKDWAATINLGPSVEALERELKSVMVILRVALGKVIHDLALEGILMELRELIYEAEDVLDEMEYFRIHGDVLDASQHVKGCAHHILDLNVLPSVHDEPPKLRFDMDNASRRIEHTVEQMQLMQQKVSSAIELLGCDWSTAPNIAQSRQITISESIEPKLYGRESMIKTIIDDITKGKHSSEVLKVIAIVGRGGTGKTTLAQHIYHSGEVQEHFDVRVWTCVSLNFNVNKLIDEIQRYIPKVDHESSNGTANELIGQRLKNKRLFLVLDDIWDCSDEDEWKQLMAPFRKSQVHGNIIIVTTRFPAQAHIMVHENDRSIYLQGIKNEEFKELFLHFIFGDDDQSRKDHTFLLETGFRIAGKLKGSPLAAKTIGRLLKTKLDLVHWTRILESKEWEHSNGKNDIMPALKLSFEYLPSQLQQCFSYCALFPQDYKFEREELINFWIGLEVLHSSHAENKRVEDIGQNHLTELVNYGFLENGGEDDGTTWYTIHDLLHELAQKVSSPEFLSIDSSQSQVSSLKVLPSVRHLSINIDDNSAKDRWTIKKCVEDFYTLSTRLKVQKLRVLMIFGEHHGCFVKAFGALFREAKALRLVFLSGASYDVKDLLHNFYYLIHLRYLRIESSSLYEVTFPKKLSRFYHMKVLDAKHCEIINDYVPRDISNLVKLRHLRIQNDTILSSIVDVGKLKSLQEFSRFVVKQEDQGFELRQIGYLEGLCGSLCIDSLENVQVPKEADEAKLMLKRHLHELVLCWNINRSTYDSALEEHVLEKLQPSSNLKKLSIIGHRGGTCPSWLGTNLSVKSLESLCLDGVAWKTHPPIGELWLDNDVPPNEISGNIQGRRFLNLQRLEILNSTWLKKWVVDAPCQLFPYLSALVIEGCSNLVELTFSHSACCQQEKGTYANLFPRLLHLKIRNCPQLLSFPPVPWTEARCSIQIQGIGSSCLDRLYCYDYVSHLTVEGKDTPDNTLWNVLDFHNLTGLKKLETYSCQPLPLRHLQMLSSLRTLVMSSNAFPFVEGDSHVKYQFPVEWLSIIECNASGKELTQLLSYFMKLSVLELKNCNKATGLGVRKQQDIIIASEEEEWSTLLLPPQLQQLNMSYCSELSLLCSNPHDHSNREGEGLQALTSLRWLEISYCPKVLSTYSSSSFSSGFPFPNSLQNLTIFGEIGTEKLVSLSNLTSLSSLSISRCEDLRGEGVFSLFTLGYLTELYIRETPNLLVDSELPWVHEQELPSCSSSKLQKLIIDDVIRFAATPIRRSLLFSSLTTLEICGDNKVNRFTEEQEALLFVNSLEKIVFVSCSNLQYLPVRLHTLQKLKSLQVWKCKAIQILHEATLPSSLQELEIDGCPEIRLFPKVCLPSSLQKIVIRRCQAIHMVPKDAIPNSLQDLVIDSCPKIRSLPKDFLPDSLQSLVIRGCPTIQWLPEVDDLPSSLRKIDVRDSESEELRRQCRKLINIIPIVRA